MAEEMAEDLASPVCALCIRPPTDARVLSCLHSFCKTCIDELDLMTGHEHEVPCPLCREKTRLPDNGASGLCKDLAQTDERAVSCESCENDYGTAEPGLWCSQCEMALCEEHTVQHIMSSGHAVIPRSHGTAVGTTTGNNASARPCEQHDLPLRYYCKPCAVFVCGDCTTLGQHAGHEDIVLVKEVTEDLRRSVRTKADELNTNILARVKRSLSAVDGVSTQLCARVEQCRAQIRAAGKRAIETIQAVVEQRVTEADDIEATCLKKLDQQRDELKQHADSVKSCVAFAERVFGEASEGENVAELLFATNKRADELSKVLLPEDPVQHCRVAFLGITEDDLLAKAGEIIGSVSACEESATHISAVGKSDKTSLQGSHATLVVSAKDKEGKPLSRGDKDALRRTQPTACPAGQATGTNNGSNHINHITFTADGVDNHMPVPTYHRELGPGVVIEDPLFVFDRKECQHGNTVANDQRSVTHSAPSAFLSVLGSCGMSTGRFSWKVQVTRSTDMLIFIGVAKKRDLNWMVDNRNSTYSWYGRNGGKKIMGEWSETRMSRWRENDILQVDLDCNLGVLSIINLRSQENDVIAHLPPGELFPYFALYHQNDTLMLVP